MKKENQNFSPHYILENDNEYNSVFGGKKKINMTKKLIFFPTNFPPITIASAYKNNEKSPFSENLPLPSLSLSHSFSRYFFLSRLIYPGGYTRVSTYVTKVASARNSRRHRHGRRRSSVDVGRRSLLLTTVQDPGILGLKKKNSHPCMR